MHAEPAPIRDAAAPPPRRPRILHVITSLDADGAQAMLCKLLAATERSPSDLAVVSLTGPGPLGPRIEALGIRVHALHMGSPPTVARGLARLARLVRAMRPDLIQGWMYHANLAALLARTLARARVPVVWNIRHTPHRLAYEKRLTAATIRLGAWCSGHAERIVYVAEESAARHEALGYRPDRRLVIPNGFDTGRFAPSTPARVELRSGLGLAPSTVLIGQVCRYHPLKDHAGFLRAAALLSRSRPDARFVLAGRGLDRSNTAVLGLVRELGLVERVHLLGETSDPARLLAGLDIATLASYSGEGFPNVIGEAMSCGVPCVVTDVGASARLVDGTGRVVPAREPAALARAWSELIDLGPEGRAALGVAARRRIQDHFALPAVVARYEALYEDVAWRGRESSR